MSIYKSCNLLGVTQGHDLNKLCTKILSDVTYQISKLWEISFREELNSYLICKSYNSCDPWGAASFYPKGIDLNRQVLNKL